MHANARTFGALALALLFAGALLLSCGESYMTSDSVSVSTDNGETLDLTAIPDNIDIEDEGTVAIKIDLYYDNNQPISNATVNLTTTRGTLGSQQLVTDTNGVGFTTLAPGEDIGWAVVTAIYKDIFATVEISFWKGGGGDTGG